MKNVNLIIILNKQIFLFILTKFEFGFINNLINFMFE
jgi:hypothetical protein